MKKLIYIFLITFVFLINGVDVYSEYDGPIGGGVGISVSNSAYDEGTWNDVTTVAPSKNAVRDKIETMAGGHDPITVDANAGAILGLTTQEINLDTQAANVVFAGPAAGIDAIPTMRALVTADMPDISAVYSPVAHTHAGVYEPIDATIIRQADVDDVVVDGVTTAPASSNALYDHENDADQHPEYLTPAEFTTAIGADNDTQGELNAKFNLKAPLADPTFTGTVVLPTNQALLGSPTFVTSILPSVADGGSVGNATYEISDIYLAADGVIYGENNQGNTLTSSATGWTANLDITAATYGGAILNATLLAMDDGATTEMQVGGGAGVAPVWTTVTGTGAPVLATSPTLVTPLLGTPTSGTLTNCTGLPTAGISDANAGTDITADLEEETHASEHTIGGADIIDRLFEGADPTAITIGDATPPVASKGLYDCVGSTTITITDFFDSEMTTIQRFQMVIILAFT